MFLYHPVTRELLFSETDDVTAVYVVLELTIPFSRLGQDLGLYLFEAFLHEVLIDFEDEFTMHVVLHLVVQEVQEAEDFPSLKPGIN